MSVPESTKRYLAEKGINPHPRQLAAAVHRANIIQRRKEMEALILSRILNLTTHPSPSTTDPATPSPDDIYTLKHALVPFQPSDYDDLIVERNIEGLCGYALCPRPTRKMPGNASFRVTRVPVAGSPGEKKPVVVKKEEYEKWCSNECIERAMYLRLQLIQQPSWEREAQAVPKFELLEERRLKSKSKSSPSSSSSPKEDKGEKKEGEKEEDTKALSEKMKKLDIGNETPASTTTNKEAAEQKKQGQADLAKERGDAADATKYYDPDADQGEVRIIEKETNPSTDSARPPSKLEPGAGAIEGYEPKYKPGPKGVLTKEDEASEDEDEDNDILDQI